MKLDKLARQLRRDLLANPKKAAVLGLMLLVAGYFWAPMIWGWIAPGKETKAVAQAADLILEDEPVSVTQRSAQAGATFRWEKARQQIADDQRMASATLPDSLRDPFENKLPAHQDQTTTEPQALAPLAHVEIDPVTAGLVLRSVLMGSRGRAAAISGEIYREGELIEVETATDAKEPLEFRLVRIGPHAVELERNGKTYLLAMERAKMAKGDEITSDRRD